MSFVSLKRERGTRKEIFLSLQSLGRAQKKKKKNKKRNDTMTYNVDVELKADSIHIAYEELLALSGTKGEDCSSVPTSCEHVPNGVDERMASFLQLLRVTIKRRVQRENIEGKYSLVLSPSDTLCGYQSDIWLDGTPTETQEKIIRSIIRVSFYQSATNGKYTIGQDNLILSLFIEKISIDLTEDSKVNRFASSGSLCEDLGTILKSKTLPRQTRGKSLVDPPIFGINMYCCLENIQKLGNKSFLNKFDGIHITSDGEDEEETLTENSSSETNHPSIHKKLGLSEKSQNMSRSTMLPSKALDGLWESLYFDDNIKGRLYNFATISLKLANLSGKGNDIADIKEQVPLINKILLVHGPPGTGKTTLCNALCQKLAIRSNVNKKLSPLDPRYRGIMVEISCPRIFSKWFGESAKNLSVILNEVEELLKAHAKSGTFVCVVIDEVETIASCRGGLMNKNESSDAVRVVNTLLTHLDSLKKYPNFIILATSNHLSELDPAFLDRADGTFLISNPSDNGIEQILTSSVHTFLQSNIILAGHSLDDILNQQKYKNSLRLLSKECFVSSIFFPSSQATCFTS